MFTASFKARRLGHSVIAAAALLVSGLIAAPAARADLIQSATFTGTINNGGATFVYDGGGSLVTTAGQTFTLSVAYNATALGAPTTVNAFTPSQSKNYWQKQGVDLSETVAFTIGGHTASFSSDLTTSSMSLFNGANKAGFELSFARNDCCGYPFNAPAGGVQITINGSNGNDNTYSYLPDPTLALIPVISAQSLGVAEQQNTWLYNGSNFINFTIAGVSTDTATVPEPISLALLGTGVVTLGLARRRKRA